MKGATSFKEGVEAVKTGEPITNDASANRLQKTAWIIDIRKEKDYKEGHLPHSVNLMEGEKFETWLGSIIQPKEEFYLAGDDKEILNEMVKRAAAIGYEPYILEAFILKYNAVKQERLDVKEFKMHIPDYTIIDVRNTSEVKEKQIFEHSIHIPLGGLRANVDKIPTNKPIVVHCVGGYRSAAASSLIQSKIKGTIKVFDLGEAIKDFI